jgi:hypothetical protein
MSRGIAAAGLVVAVAVPYTSTDQPPTPQILMRDVHLTSVVVPPGGLITSFLGNQVKYCSIICPLLVDTAVTATTTTLRAPVTFLSAVQADGLVRAIGAAAASVTGPTNAAAEAAILADGTRVAPRALNALEVLVVGLLGVIPGAAADGVHGVLEALQTTRQNTFTALNLPIVANPVPTAMPSGVLQVTVVSALNVIGAVIFPAFNHVLSALFETPDAFAQELAASGKLGKAIAAGTRAAATELAAAGTDIAGSVVTAVHDIRSAIGQNHRSRQSRRLAVTTSTVSPTTRSFAGPADRHAPHPSRDAAAGDTDRRGVEKATDHRAISRSSRISHDRPAHRGGRHRG